MMVDENTLKSRGKKLTHNTLRLSESCSFSNFVDSWTIAIFSFFFSYDFPRQCFKIFRLISSQYRPKWQMIITLAYTAFLFTFTAVGKSLALSSQPRLIIITFCLKRACIFVGWMVFWLSLAAETESVRTKPCHWSLSVKDKTIPACVMQIAREQGSQQLKCAFKTNSREKNGTPVK